MASGELSAVQDALQTPVVKSGALMSWHGVFLPNEGKEENWEPEEVK